MSTVWYGSNFGTNVMSTIWYGSIPVVFSDPEPQTPSYAELLAERDALRQQNKQLHARIKRTSIETRPIKVQISGGF